MDVLDSLRGWAILAVISIHVAQFAPPGSPLLQRIVINGDMGVILFYVLSAFSLTMSLQARSHADRISIRSYFIRRFFRIAPMFWLAVALSGVLFFHKPSFWSPEGIGLTEIFTTAIFLHGLHPAIVNAVVPGGWSVAIEVMFYLILPFIFKFSTRPVHLLAWIALSLLCYTLCGTLMEQYWSQVLPPSSQYLAGIYAWNMSLPAQLPVFIIGVVTYRIAVKQLVGKLAYVIFASGLLAMMLLSPTMEFRHLLWALVFAALILAIYKQPFALLDNAALRAMGKVSYSAYLLHFILLMYLSKVFRHLPVEGVPKFLLLYACTVMVTYAMAAWTYKNIELPCLSLGSRYSKQYEIASRGNT